LRDDANDAALVERLRDAVEKLRTEIGKAIIGQTTVVERIVAALLCRGHVLLVGAPGLAKTLMIRTLADALDLKFGRIQFTPDLMPSDITGTEIIEEDAATKRRNLRFVKGPIFANVVLADEINRTPPKTQAALLEAMQENRVTAAGVGYPLEPPFFVLATQNPIEQEGTYPLPEAQLDRFMFNLWLDYPSPEEEIEIVRATTGGVEPAIEKTTTAEELLAFQELTRRVPVADNVIEFATALVGKTRPGTDAAPDYVNQWVRWGAGPRASQFLILAAKAFAVMDGRFTPNEDDVRAAAIPTLRHRVLTNFTAEAEGVGSVEVVERLLGER
jgi:MoxR-like ATPase